MNDNADWKGDGLSLIARIQIWAIIRKIDCTTLDEVLEYLSEGAGGISHEMAKDADDLVSFHRAKL